MKKAIVDIAVDEALRSGQNMKHGAVIVRSGKILSSGHNKVTNKGPSHMFSCHAEMAAIKQSTKRGALQDAHLYVVRINNCGLADSKPCCNCQRFMKIHGISRVFFSTNSGTFDSMYIT